MKRTLIRAMAMADDVLDEVLYRPAAVRAFTWLPRWWLCDLAKLSMVLDDRWSVGYWAEADIAPGRPCDACGRRASIHLLGGRLDEDEPDDQTYDAQFLDEKVVHLCGWCHIEGPILNEDDLQRELAAAASDSVAWRWRWQPARR